MTHIVHCKRSPYDTYIGRESGGLPASKWGNPFIIGVHGTREECVAQYETWIRAQPDLMGALPELKDKTLGCWCLAGQLCHGGVLVRLLAELDE